MEEAIPPWGPPVVRCVPDSGAENGTPANHWKQWDAKPEAGVQFSALRSFGCNPANHRKRWDAKPEAKARSCAMLVRLPDSLRPKMGKERKF